MNTRPCATWLLCLAAVGSLARGQTGLVWSEEVHLQSLTPEQLKRAYLECDHAMTQGRLGMHDAMSCGMAYEVLKRRVFGGDSEQLLAWWRVNRYGPDGRAAAQAAP
jgi:hypothetical protein